MRHRAVHDVRYGQPTTGLSVVVSMECSKAVVLPHGPFNVGEGL